MIVYPLWSHLRSAQVPCLVWYQPVLLAVDLDFHLCLSVPALTTALQQPHLSSYVLPFGEPLNQVVSPNRTARRLSCIGHWVYLAVGAHCFLQPRTTENRTGCIHGGIQRLLFSSASRSFRLILHLHCTTDSRSVVHLFLALLIWCLLGKGLYPSFLAISPSWR
jgi:hypothetical protein